MQIELIGLSLLMKDRPHRGEAMNTGPKIIAGTREGHIDVMSDIESKAMDINSLVDGLEFLVESIDYHLSPNEDSREKANGLSALLYCSIEAIKKKSVDIQELSNRMKRQEREATA